MRKIGFIAHFFFNVNICFFLCICVIIFGKMLLCVHLVGTPCHKLVLASMEKLCVTAFSLVSDLPLFPCWKNPTDFSETRHLRQ